MHISRLILLIVVAAAVLAACGGAPAVETAPTAPTLGTAPTAAAGLTTGPAPTATTAPTAGIASTAPNDATQARLRLALFVFGGPNVDLFVNSTIAVNGGMAQANLHAGYVNGYLFLTPGTYRVAVVPTGKGLAQAILGPLDVPVVAGHRYTLAMIGQLTDPHFTPLVIDETAALQQIHTSAPHTTLFVVNNLAGTKTIDWLTNGQGPRGVVYGGFGAAAITVSRTKDIAIYMNGDPKAPILGTGGGGAVLIDGVEPGVDYMAGTVGHFPGAVGPDNDEWESLQTSDLNPITFMQGYSGAGIAHGSTLSFDTFLAAIKTAGLTDLLTTGGPYLVLAPTDEAFAALPKATRDALMADPKALADLVRNHIVAGYIPRGSLAKTPGGPFDRTLTNMLGAKLAIGDGFSVNGTGIGDFSSTFVANGTQVHPITTVLLPATK
jgi:uncharacterized surface protein with fasciclin (FAS1) repeats